MDNFNILVSGGFQEDDLVSDGWTDIIRKLLVMVQQDQGAALAPTASARPWSWPTSRRWSRSARAWTRSSQDPATAEALKPYYRQFCKRPVLPRRVSADLQPAERHARRHAGARASSGSPSAAWSPNGVEYAVDCLIYATGFEVGTDYTRRAGYEIYGRGGAQR